MVILVFGGSGLIGKEFCAHAMMNGHTPVVVSRSPDKVKLPYQVIGYADIAKSVIQRMLSGSYAAINLSGAGIADKKWTPSQKKYLESSRIDILDRVELFLQQAPQEPDVFLQASAVGYYGNTGDEKIDEDSPAGNNFLAELATKWEKRFKDTALEDSRKIVMRTGVVLTTKGGFFPRILKPFKMFVGGVVGSGEQYLSWIHIQDHVRAMLYVIEDKYAYGVYNFTAPNPVKMKKFAKELGAVLHRPTFMPIPGFFLKMLYGQMAQETMLEGTRALPKKLIDHEFEFIFSDISLALKNLVNKNT